MMSFAYDLCANFLNDLATTDYSIVILEPCALRRTVRLDPAP